MFDIQAQLGANKAVSITKFTIYLPDRDQTGRQFADFDAWVETGLALLALINDGATRLPASQGRWRGEAPMVSEWTTLVYSHIDEPDRFEQYFERIVRFLHTFGSRTNQHTVLAEWAGEGFDIDDDGKEVLRYLSRAYRITSFGSEVSSDVATQDLLTHLGRDLVAA